MQKFYIAKNEASQKNFLFVSKLFFLLALLFSSATLFAQINPASTGRSCARKPVVAGQTQNFINTTSLEMERERRKSLLSTSQRAIYSKAPAAIKANASQHITESVFLSGTLSSADPTFNRTLTMTQGGTCGLSGVGTATHYKTHTFTLTSASNVTLSVLTADGGALTPAGADTFLELYGPGGFNPASACTNLIAANDDAAGVGPSRIITTTPLAPGTYTAVFTSFDNEPTNFPWNYTLAILYTEAGVCAPGNIVNDGGFETTSPFDLTNPSWATTSTNFGSPLCDAGNCGTGGGTAGARNGSFWSWFGGAGAATAEAGSLQQSVIIPVGATVNLNYYLWIGAVTAPFDATMRVLVDGAVQTTHTEPAVAESGYTLRTLSLSSFADGNPHVIRFEYSNSAASGNSNFNVDDVSVDIVSCAACVPVTITTQPINTSGCLGTTTTLSVTATGTLPNYQWQINSGSGFVNLANNATYSGVTTSTLTIAATPVSLNGNQYRVIVGGVCSSPVNSNPATITVNQNSHSAVVVTPTVMCSPGVISVTATATGAADGNVTLGSSGPINLAIPDNTPAGVNSTIAITKTFASAADLKLRLNLRHSWSGDVKVTLTSPCGTTIVFDRPGVPASTFGNGANFGTSSATTPPPAVYIFDIAGGTIIPETAPAAGFIPAGIYQPSNSSNPGVAHNWAGLTFPCGAGNWTLNISDNGAGDVGALVDWAILKTNTYTHTLTGPGTIVQNPPTGAANANASFSVTGIPPSPTSQNFVLTSTDAAGCSAVSNVSVTVNPTPVITFVQTPNPICNGGIQQITPTVTPPTPITFSQGSTIIVPGGQAVVTSGNANPYPSQITVSGLPTTNVSVKSVKLGNVNHTFPADMDIVLVSPTGQSVILMSDAGGDPDVVGLDYTFEDGAAATLSDITLNPQGSYKPTNYGATDNFPAPGPGSLTQATPTLASFTGNANGDWKLYVVDDATGNFGFIGNWSITFNTPTPIVFSPTTNLFTDAAATIPYTGTPILTGSLWSKPTTTTTYTVTGVLGTCTGTANVTVTVNQLPAITVQPVATQTACTGTNVSFSVTATGTGLTYQWRKNGVNLLNGGQLNGTVVSGATTNTLTLSIVSATDAANYTVVVSGSCPPAVTSAAGALVIATAPTITTQPANVTACLGSTATFSVVAAGSPAPTFYQWQVSTAAVPAFTNILVGSFATPTLVLPNVDATMNGNRYRVVITNTCGQTITTNGLATLTVAPLTGVTATALPARICLSDGPIALVGSPVGGSWSGIGVSGSNFVPGATANGTYTLTYTYSNTSGCVGSATTIANVVSNLECVRENRLRDNALILYPNPNNGNFNIRVNSILYNYLNMRVFNTAGNLISTRDYNGLVFGQVIPIDLTHLPAGTYMVRFFYNDGARTSEKVFPVVIGRQ